MSEKRDNKRFRSKFCRSWEINFRNFSGRKISIERSKIFNIQISIGSESVFDDTGEAVMCYRDLMKNLREMEKENFSLKTRVYFLEDALSQYIETEGEETRADLRIELDENRILLETANDTITQLRMLLEDSRSPFEDDFASARISQEYPEYPARTSIESFEELENYAKTIQGSDRLGVN